MGLDMYLKGKRYISTWREDEKPRSEAVSRLFPELAAFGDDSVINEVSAEVGYWRKANAIHKWFVDNVQSGTDDCGNYRVSREALQELRDTCERVLGFKHLAEGQLPTAEGFFFGSTGHDEWYYQYVEDTIQIIDRCLALPPEWDFEYHSSW